MTRCWIPLLTLILTAATSTARAWEPVAGSRESAPRWSGRMIYRLNEAGSDDLDRETLSAEVHRALLEWTIPECTGASARYDGLTSEPPPSNAGAPGADNVIAWRESDWRDGAETVAVTAPSFVNTNSGAQVIVAATMRLNGQDWTWVKGASAGRHINVYSVLLHEGGHYWGLGHSLVPSSVMVERYSRDLTGLSPDDSDGICSLYPLPKSEDCACPHGYACTRGNCLWNDAGAPPSCDAGFCMKRVQACVIDRDCDSSDERCIGGQCIVFVDPPSAACMGDSDCASGQVCKTGDCVTHDAAQPDGLPTGRDCRMDSDCESGLCRFADGVTQCTAFCTSDGDCGAAQECLRESTATGLCSPSGQVSARAHAKAEAGSGCSSTRSSRADATAWLLLAAWLVRARRRRSSSAR